jgi:hypothetical protein
MANALKSKTFIRKVMAMTPAERQDVEKTIGYILANPSNKAFVRPYTAHYLLDHLQQNKQYTIYFEIQNAGQNVYFIWINDPSCLHNTWGNAQDPDIKEFTRLRTNGLLELFDQKIHEGVLTIRPQVGAGNFFDFKKLEARILCNVFTDGHIFATTGIRIDSDSYGDFYDLPKIFLQTLADHFKKANLQFEIQLHTNTYSQLIATLTAAHNPAVWHISVDQDITVLRVV